MTLAAGEAVFWVGPTVDSSGGSCTPSTCFTYRLVVEEPGYRLRIGIDQAELDDAFSATVTSPSGQRFEPISSGLAVYSAELLVEDPEIGEWRIEVSADDATSSSFRMRAKLERDDPKPGGSSPVLPNLQVLPPHAASFLMPVSNGNTPGAPIAVDLDGADSCHPEEHVEDLATRCLRFAFGVRNTGKGPLSLLTRGVGPDLDLVQYIHRPDGSYVERNAGTARYHKTHAHYHQQDAVALQLFEVVDAKRGLLEPAGEKRFKGFAHQDELLREWSKFYPTWDKVGFGLLAGWSDIYEWDRPGNYLPFGDNGDGRYVVRMWADPNSLVKESNESDNVGYTYLEVAGSDVELIESGRGSDPWDRCKIVVGFGAHPDPGGNAPRPRACRPDTV